MLASERIDAHTRTGARVRRHTRADTDLATGVDRLEEGDDRILELVVEVVLKVERHVLLLDIDGILQRRSTACVCVCVCVLRGTRTSKELAISP